MTPEQANKIFDVLVSLAGAYEGDRKSFVQAETDPEMCREFRFCGKLGFGGKFWVNDGRWYINCYSEDMTAPRRKFITDTNAALEKLKKEID